MVIVAESVCKNMYKKKKMSNVLSLEEVEYEITDQTDVCDEVVYKLTVETILQKIKTLPNIYKQVLLLKLVYEFKDNEIAGLLEINPTTARKRLERARNKLTEVYKKERGKK